MKRIKLQVHGRVQGVGFRFFIGHVASNYNVTGYVKNLDNGDVLAKIQGDPKDLDEIVLKILKGNRFSMISGHELCEEPVVDGEKRFRTEY